MISSLAILPNFATQSSNLTFSNNRRTINLAMYWLRGDLNLHTKSLILGRAKRAGSWPFLVRF